MIYFDPTTHTYHNVEGFIYDSPSKILRQYKNTFPAQEAARKYAKNHGQTAEYWLNQWKQTTDSSIYRGNTIHADREEEDFAVSLQRYKSKLMRVENAERYFVTDLTQLPDGIYPEMNIWNNSWRIAGRPDRVIIETIGGVRYADIEDYKTNRKIEKVSYAYQGQHKMMLRPVAHLMDTKWSQYCLQLSFYQYILETHGFKPRDRKIIHIKHPVELFGLNMQPEDEILDVPYLKKEVLNILRDYDRKRTFDKLKTNKNK